MNAILLAEHHHWFPLAPLLLVALWFVVVTNVVRRRCWSGGWCGGGGRPGESVLAERYASGEIDESELHARRAVLRNDAAPDGRRGRRPG